MVVRASARGRNARLVAEKKTPFLEIDDLAGELA
jgi:hypothetical protein